MLRTSPRWAAAGSTAHGCELDEDDLGPGRGAHRCVGLASPAGQDIAGELVRRVPGLASEACDPSTVAVHVSFDLAADVASPHTRVTGARLSGLQDACTDTALRVALQDETGRALTVAEATSAGRGEPFVVAFPPDEQPTTDQVVHISVLPLPS